MSVLVSSLKEELARVLRLEKKYGAVLAHLPKGSFVVRKRGSCVYGYLTFREGEAVRQKYLGRLSDEECATYRKMVEERKRVRKQLGSVRQQKKILERALRGQTA